MESLSLVNEEVKKKISRLLGKNSSLLFVCFCRVLYAKKDSKLWMSYINGQINGKMIILLDILQLLLQEVLSRIFLYIPLFSLTILQNIYLLMIQTFDLRMCFEFYDKIEEPIHCSDLCYIIPHKNLSFCLLFTNQDDALILSYGV